MEKMHKRLQRKIKRGTNTFQTSYKPFKDSTFLFTWSKAATEMWSMPDQIHCEIHPHWMYLLGPYKRKLLLCIRHERTIPKNRNLKNVVSFPKAVNLYGKNLKEY